MLPPRKPERKQAILIYDFVATIYFVRRRHILQIINLKRIGWSFISINMVFKVRQRRKFVAKIHDGLDSKTRPEETETVVEENER